MQPNPETCGELLTPLRSLIGLKQFALQLTARLAQGEDPLPHAAAGLLGELVHSGETRAGDLAQHRIVDASVVSRQAAQLEQAGLVTRRPDPADRRVSLLRATPEGERAFATLERRKKEWLSHALRDWSETEVRHLTDLLDSAARDLRSAVHELREQHDHVTTQEGTG